MTSVPYAVAIETRYRGPSNTRGSYITARWTHLRHSPVLSMPYEPALNSDENHERAAETLRARSEHWAGPHYVITSHAGTLDGYIWMVQPVDAARWTGQGWGAPS